MKLRILAASTVTLATLLTAAPSLTYAQIPPLLEQLMKTADKNKNGMITREEFTNAMGMAYDKAMAKMKTDPKMVKGSSMTMDGIKAVIDDLYKGS